MRLSDFDFCLPPELIAQKPVPQRDQSRLMVVDRSTSRISHDLFANLSRYLKDHPLMVFNDTRVMPAKLAGIIDETGRDVEVLLVREMEPGLWEALIKGLKRIKTNTRIVFAGGSLTAVLQGRKDNLGILRLSHQGNLREILSQAARMPLPPYIARQGPEREALEQMDRTRYQTVYAAKEGAIAAPTAGLHFTQKMIDEIGMGLADIAFITLHVGVGTFMPVRSENAEQHRMESENYFISRETWNKVVDAKKKGRHILAVGTTTTRVLESVCFDSPASGDVSGWTDAFLFPGKRFNTINHLLTNFHLPRSTLFMLVSAFSSLDLMQKAYQEAIRDKYRFFSYGDAMLIL